MTSLKELNASIGQMRIFITAQALVNKPGQPLRNETGGTDGVWVTQFQFWGKVEWKRGWNQSNAERRQPYYRAYIVARFDTRLQNGMRILFKDQNTDHVLTVQAYSNVEQRNHLMEIDAEEGIGT